MSHEVLGDLFFQERAKPAWHRIMREGIDPNREYTAIEVYSLFGKPTVILAPLQTVGKRKDGSHIAIPNKAIIRPPLDDNTPESILGIVSDEYVIVTPEEIVDLFDTHVGKPVKTMMFLRDGKLMVITVKLDTWSVRGEEVENYAQIGNWMDGASASRALVSRVCTVCMNTWQAANSSASESFRFVHDDQIKHRMGRWFEDVMERLDAKTAAAREAMDILARTKIGKTVDEAKSNVDTVLGSAYTPPAEPDRDPLASDEWNDERRARWEELRKTVDMRRATALGLFMGEGTGMRLPSRHGTLWGLYQAVCEVEDYRKGAKGDSLASAILFGERGQAKDRAFNAALSIATS